MDRGRIVGRCGYLDLHSRTIVLNPDAPDDALEAELLHDLERLRAAARPHDPPAATGPVLVHATDTPEQPPRRDDGGDGGKKRPDLRVVG